MKHTLAMAIRSLRARPSRTLLTVAGIVLGVAVILAISITNLSTLDSLAGVFSAASGKANLVVLSATDNEEGFAERVRGVVLGTPGVQDAVPSLQMTVFLAGQDLAGQRETSMLGGATIRLVVYGIDPSIDDRAREYAAVEGSLLPSDLNAYEIVLVKEYADEHEIEVGEDIDLLTEAGLETVRVTGLISKEGVGQTNNGAFGVMPLGAAQEIFGRTGDLDQIDVIAAPGHADGDGLDALQSALEDRLGTAYTVAYPASQGKRVVQMLDVYQMGLSFFSVIAIIVGAFLIYNTFTMTVVERTREIGMLRTVGMTSRQVMGQIMTESVILGVVGAGLGVGAGVLMARGLIRLMEYLLNQPVREVQVPFGGLLTSIGIGLAVTLFASGIPAMQAGRISPLEALRVRGNQREQWWVRRGWPWGIGLLLIAVAGFYVRVSSSIQYYVSNGAVTLMSVGAMFIIPVTVHAWVLVLSPLLRGLYKGEGQLGTRNIERGKQRTTMTVIALMVSIGMVYSIQALAESFRVDVQAWIDGYIGGDLYVYSGRALRYDLGQRLEAVSGVEAVTPMRRVDVKVLKADGTQDTLAYYAYDPESYRRVTSFVFSDPKADSEMLMDRLAQGDVVFISTVVSDKYDLVPGDTIRLETRRGQRDFEVGAIVSEFNDRGFALEGSWKDLRRYFGVNDVSAFQIKISPGASQAQVEAEIDRLYGERQHLTIESNEAMKAEAMSVVSQAFSMFDVLAIIAVIVAALGVINTLTMSVLERTREIGMLRGVGMTRWQVVKMILAEAGTVGVMGGVFGVVYGLFMSRLFIGGANITQGYQLSPVIPTQGLIAGLVIAIVVSQVAALMPASRAARLEVIEALQFE
ncbi:MAG TPA: FtsX-like permease family protein [Anaerolineae bacterium]|nr:FtsX-like permease family protein [Anaerolineae bacterium]